MDYSLLLAVYNVDEMKQRNLEESSSHKPSFASTSTDVPLATPPASSQPGTSAAASAIGGASVATPGAINRGRSTKARLQQFTTAMESIQADVDPVEIEDEDIPYVCNLAS
mgnify:CR=1 FL=1